MRGLGLTVTSGVGARAAAPTRYRLSRYPTRTAPAAPGHIRRRARPPTTANGPSSRGAAAIPAAVRIPEGGPERSAVVLRPIQPVDGRPRWAR
jgi:hypothetical protein